MSDAPTEPSPPSPPVPAVTRQTLIIDVLETRPDAGRVLRETYNLPCEECVVSEVETVEQGAGYYGHDADEMVRKLNECPPRATPPGAASPG